MFPTFNCDYPECLLQIRCAGGKHTNRILCFTFFIKHKYAGMWLSWIQALLFRVKPVASVLVTDMWRESLSTCIRLNLRTVRPIYRTGLPLPSKCCILYMFFSTNISTEYIKNSAHSPFISSKCHLFHNATFFGSCLIHILHTGCARI
jgi:hypothetical protein